MFGGHSLPEAVRWLIQIEPAHLFPMLMGVMSEPPARTRTRKNQTQNAKRCLVIASLP